MKKLLLVSLLLLLTGCAMLGTMKTCMDDPACFADKLAQAQKVKTQVTAVADVVSPVPWAGPVAGGLAGIGTLLVGLYLGGKKKQEGK